MPLPPQANTITLEVALIERPREDSYLNQELWEFVDEQIVALERKAALKANGLRVGLISGMPPAGLQALLTSDRSCSNPRRVQRQIGDSTTLLLGQTMPHCRFELRQEAQWQGIHLEQAECSLVVAPSLTQDGRTRLHFTPQIRHGQGAVLPRPSLERSGTYLWKLDEHRATETYTALSWEVTMSDNEYVVVGTWPDRTETLGHRCFVDGAGPHPVQRLLVVRTARPRSGIAAEDEDYDKQTPALAAQASVYGFGKYNSGKDNSH